MEGIDERTRDLIQRRVLKRVNDIPSLPQFVIETLNKLEDPKSSASDVAAKLFQDEGLVVRILRLANSAYYGVSRKITGISEAIAFLGFKTVKSIVLAASVYKFMDGAFSGYALDRGALWKHSLSVSLCGRYIAKKYGGVDEEEAYIAGMMHDLGKIILNDYVRFGYSIIIRLVEEDKVPFLDAEKQVLGFNHAQVGGLVIEQWNLPESYIYTTTNHHDPWNLPADAANYSRLVDVVHVANSVCLMLGAGIGGDGLQYALSEDSLAHLGITDIEGLMSDLVDILPQVEEELGLSN